jgi:ABC-2 type transport system ATP-binding protein
MELRIDGLSKTYANGVKALDNVSLTVPQGMFGLLGQNGAGKSTLMRSIATLQEADSGSATLGGIDVLRDKDGVRRILGYLPQDFGVYPRVTAVEMLDHLALLKGVRQAKQRKELVEAMLQKVNLWEHRKKALTGYSGGMRQRFGIAQALLGDPKLLIVDEPTAGLDPGERNRFYNLLAEIGESVIVILSTHIVEDVMELCSKMAILHRGRVFYEGGPEDAVRSLDGKVYMRKIPKAELKDYEARYKVISSKMVAGQPLIHVFSEEPLGDGFALANASLEDVFFTRIGGLAGGEVSGGAGGGEKGRPSGGLDGGPSGGMSGGATRDSDGVGGGVR